METTKQFDAGLDMGMFNNRLTLTVDAYLKRSSNLLTLVNVPLSTGSLDNSVIQNIGQIQNKGLEVGLVTTNVQAVGNGFNWTTNFNVTFNRNRILDLGTQLDSVGKASPRKIPNGSTIQQAGSAIGSFYGYKVAGIFQSQDEINHAPTQPNASPGDIRFVDVNHDGKIDEKDQTIIGNPNPKAIAGVTNTFTYKGIELSVFFQASFGNDIYNQNRQVLEGNMAGFNQDTRVLDSWTPTHTNTDVPRAVLNDPNGNASLFSTRFIEDGSYVRLKNLTLAYNFPLALVQKAKMSNLRLYVTAQNLVTWTHYSGYDPEVSADPLSTTSIGRDYGVYPQSRTYTVGVNATF